MAWLVWGFEGTKKPDVQMHHKQYQKVKLDFKAGVISYVYAFDKLGNYPFLQDIGKLIY